MPQPLLEGLRGAVPFMVDRTQEFVKEDRNGKSFTRIPGRFSICDSVNGNNRRYSRKVWEKNLAEGSTLRQSIARNAAFGLLEHPANGQISLQSPICIAVTDAKLQPGTDRAGKSVMEVVGDIAILNTPEGQRLQALIEFGYNPLVSSRGFGSVTRASDGVDEVMEDYICEGWDVVLKPSFETAELRPDQAKESAPAAKQESQGKNVEAPVGDGKPAPASAAPTLEAASPSKPEAAATAASESQLTEKAMTINEIKSRIGAVAGTKVPSDPARFAEGLNEMAQLHQEIANFVAEDAKRSWQGQQLHDQLKTVEQSWSEAAQSPAKQAKHVSESYRKVLRVTKVLGEAAVGIKKRLAEALSQNAEATQLVEELTGRGQQWVAYAESLKRQLAEAQEEVDVTCEALDILADRYNEDMTAIGKRQIELEFAEAVKAPEIAKRLSEAKLPADIIAIRETLAPKTPKAESKDESKGEKAGAKTESKEAPKGESKEAAKAEDKKPVSEAKADENEARVLVPSARTVSESVEMVKRLSASAK